MDAAFRDDAPNRKRGAATYKAGNFTITGPALTGTIWAPATGNTLRVYRIKMSAFVTTVLAGATATDQLVVCDNAVGAPLGNFTSLNQGVSSSTRVTQLGQVISTTDAITVFYGYLDVDFGTAGLRLAAKNNVLKAAGPTTLTTGVITFNGFVIGIEEPY